MSELDQLINTSDLDFHFARALSEAAYAMFEARNINKDYLKQEADATGDPTRFQTARQSVQTLWAQEDMAHQLNGKAAQKVLNFLYLMEIRSPGFTTVDKLHAIHDLYVGNTLDTKFLSQVNSDTTPAQAEQVLSGATEHQAKSNKVYPDLTDEEEAIWNRVRVYHEFDDGFKWVYAVNPDGSIASHIPSNITFKTMHHCGNTPDARSSNQYWELRGPDGKAYLTVILSPEGKIEESKSWGNQPNKYRRMIQPYVKWFLKNKVTGVGYRYDYGYATHNNFGVKDFMGDDPDFIEYVIENKPELFGNTEKRIMFWKEAIEQNVVTVDDIKRMFSEGYTLQAALRKSTPLSVYHAKSKFREWGENSPRYHRSDESIFGSNPFDVVCAACGGCPFNDDELKALIKGNKVSLEEFANYDIHLLTPDMQKAFVSANSYNLTRLMEIASEVGTFEVAGDIMSPLIDTLRDAKPTKPDGYEGMSWQERHDNRAAADFEKKINHWESALYAIKKYMSETNPPEKARPVVDAVFGDPVIMNNIFGADFDNYNPTGGYHYRPSYRDADSWLCVFARYKDIEIPKVMMEYLANYLFGTERKGSRTMSLLIKVGRPRIDALFENRTPKEIANACIDTSRHLKLDARNLLPTVKNLGDLVNLFPEYSNIYSVLRPSLRLGYYCCAPRETTNVPAAVEMAVAQIHKGEAIPNNPNAMLSATGAATMMAIGTFPEIMEHVTAAEVGDYIFPQSAMIEHTSVSDGPRMLSEHLIDILKEAYSSYSEEKKNMYNERAARIFMCASHRYGVIKEGDPIFNDIYVHLAKDDPWCDTMTLLTGYRFYPSIPREEWDNVAKMITTPYRNGKQTFIETYILPALNNGRFAEDQYMMDYLVSYILNPSVNAGSVLKQQNFRKRPILNKVKSIIMDRIKNGEDIPLEVADRLNKAGLLKKEFLAQAEVQRFDEQSESDIDESIVGKLDRMCNDDTLKKYKKSRNFPYFANELLRAILEQYDMRCNQSDKSEDYFDAVAFLMYHNFSRVADFILASPKTPTCLAAAKLARQSGLLDAYRMVADRFGPGKRSLRPMYLEDGHRGFIDRDLSPEFISRIDQLDQLGQTKQKYKAEEGELPMK